MNTTVVCRDVRPALGNSKRCVVVVSRDEREAVGTIDPGAGSNLTQMRDRLDAQGIVLGGPLQPVSTSSTQGSLASPIRVSASDELVKEVRLIVDQMV